jgi:hypothetical protein
MAAGTATNMMSIINSTTLIPTLDRDAEIHLAIPFCLIWPPEKILLPFCPLVLREDPVICFGTSGFE